MSLKKILFALLVIGITSCKEKPTENNQIANKNETKVVSVDNELAYEKIKPLNLDSHYTNLLDPRNTTETELKKAMKAWSEFHKNVSEFIKSEKFDWEVPDSTITVVNKIYFSKKGTVDYYTFKIMNETVTPEKKEAYEKVLQKFSEKVKIDLERDEQYAQCGKIKYVNY
ncbi:hypothetical protein [Mesoflavibacter zeaxanthinifaciens]|uniref:hypothetical protein n=1 Tax=Mesoflavibacter zeaxanthinifaciens TaxID=393060 RepID=UPI003A951DEB